MLVMTVLEARVAPEHWPALEKAYRLAAKDTTPGLVQSFLVQHAKDNDLWRILTVWSSREALKAVRNSGRTPRGVLIFREAHAEPSLAVFDVAQEINKI